jgi:hypothetical protein
VDAPSGKINRDSAPPPATPPTPHNTPAKALLLLVGYNTGAAAHPDDITNSIILNQLRLAALDAHDLQISPAIAINAAAPELLEPLGTTSTLATEAFPPRALLIEDWPQPILSSATIVSFTNNGDYTTDDLLCGTLEHLATSSPSLRKHTTGQVAAGQVYNLPQSLQVIILTRVLPSATLDGRFYTSAPLLLVD